MKTGTVIVLAFCLGVLAVAPPAGASTVTSNFNNFVYSYTVTPAPGESIRDFHVYASVEGDPSHYLNPVMPPGWQFTIVQLPGRWVITWWTTGPALPVGVAASFGYTHYCAPCCHTWFVTGTGTSNPDDPAIDGSWNHSEEYCNIPAPFDAGCPPALGGVVAPIYPNATPAGDSTWGRIKAVYR